MVEVLAVPVLSDNYVWLMHDGGSGETVVVDPGVADPVLEAASRRGWRITQIWNTHWHADHVGGNLEVKAATGARVTGPAAEADRIPGLDVPVREGDRARIGVIEAVVMEVPAHTGGHIAYHLPDEAVLFVGDTLFAMGCGRLFEGTAEQMHANLQRFSRLPPETRVYCAHEYTLSNARFALSVDRANEVLRQRAAEVERLRAEDEPTVPTTIALERDTNPFMRADTAEALAQLRQAKDNFR